MGRKINTSKFISDGIFKLSIGTTDKKNPLVFYIEGSASLKPLSSKDNYNQDISLFRHSFEKGLFELLKTCDFLDKRFILDFETGAKKMAVNRITSLNFQLFLRQSKDRMLDFKDLEKEFMPKLKDVLQNLGGIIAQHHFLLSKKKE